jgi:hypothetical protein
LAHTIRLIPSLTAKVLRCPMVPNACSAPASSTSVMMDAGEAEPSAARCAVMASGRLQTDSSCRTGTQ